MVPNENKIQDKIIRMSLFHRILVEMKGLHLKAKHNNKNSAFDIPYEIRHFQAGRNPRDDKMC